MPTNDRNDLAVAMAAFERLYRRAPNDGERRHLADVQAALGLDGTSEWWGLFLAAEDTAARLTAAGEAAAGARAEADSSIAETAEKLAALVASLSGEMRAFTETAAKRQDRAVAEVAASVTEAFTARIKQAQGVSIQAALRAFAIFGGIGLVVGILATLGATYSGLLPPPIDSVSQNWLRWALSDDGQAARRFSITNASVGGIEAIARCDIPGARKDGATCHASFGYLP